MKRTIVRYTVKPGQEEINADLVRAVYRELAELRPRASATPPTALTTAGPLSTSPSRRARATARCGDARLPRVRGGGSGALRVGAGGRSGRADRALCAGG